MSQQHTPRPGSSGSPPPVSRRPVEGLSHEELQPAGNAAAQEDTERESFGDAWWHYTPPGAALYWLGAAADAVGEAWTDAEAQSWWTEYQAAGESRRQEMALAAWRDGTLQRKIDALSERQQVDPAQLRDELGEVLDYLQQFETMRAAGMTWEEMAQAQGQYMLDQARERAADNPGTDVLSAHEGAVADQDYLGPEDTSWWDGLTDVERAAWIARGAAAVAVWVAHARRTRPELDIQASEIGVDIPGNSNSVAYVDGDGKCWIGRETIVAIERDPAYADSTIMHELRGHPEFDTGFSLSMELYDAAAPTLPGYTRPAEGSDERNAEWTRFEYFESEIGALMREERFWVASRDIDGSGTIEPGERNPLGAPNALLDTLLRNLAGQFAPELQGPFVTGLARRFEADPRVTPEASAMFADACQRLLGVRV